MNIKATNKRARLVAAVFFAPGASRKFYEIEFSDDTIQLIFDETFRISRNSDIERDIEAAMKPFTGRAMTPGLLKAVEVAMHNVIQHYIAMGLVYFEKEHPHATWSEAEWVTFEGTDPDVFEAL